MLFRWASTRAHWHMRPTQKQKCPAFATGHFATPLVVAPLHHMGVMYSGISVPVVG